MCQCGQPKNPDSAFNVCVACEDKLLDIPDTWDDRRSNNHLSLEEDES